MSRDGRQRDLRFDAAVDVGHTGNVPEYRDSAIDSLRVAPSAACWWCGDTATTREHKYKASELRRISTANGASGTPSEVFKSSPYYEDSLRSLKRGDEVKWGMNLCATCNGHRSQPFDRAYDRFSEYVQANICTVWALDQIEWTSVYGSEWRNQTISLARYFGKQLGCMLATQGLPVPPALADFLNGSSRCPGVSFRIGRSVAALEAHAAIISAGHQEGLLHYIGIPETPAYSDGTQLTGAVYAYQIAYILVSAEWFLDSEEQAFFENEAAVLPLV
ncbi:hypothetical protein [Parafrigoribacterium humi]|uniref:hypothetical protein n=1 Tax=Parafrigoribacterium humi TaxID=3144664 RepID=UPI0032EADF0F